MGWDMMVWDRPRLWVGWARLGRLGCDSGRGLKFSYECVFHVSHLLKTPPRFLGMVPRVGLERGVVRPSLR